MPFLLPGPAVRGHISPAARVFPASKVRHRHPDPSRDSPRHARGNVHRAHPHEICQKAEAEGFLISFVWYLLRCCCLCTGRFFSWYAGSAGGHDDILIY